MTALRRRIPWITKSCGKRNDRSAKGRCNMGRMGIRCPADHETQNCVKDGPRENYIAPFALPNCIISYGSTLISICRQKTAGYGETIYPLIQEPMANVTMQSCSFSRLFSHRDFGGSHHPLMARSIDLLYHSSSLCST